MALLVFSRSKPAQFSRRMTSLTKRRPLIQRCSRATPSFPRLLASNSELLASNASVAHRRSYDKFVEHYLNQLEFKSPETFEISIQRNQFQLPVSVFNFVPEKYRRIAKLDTRPSCIVLNHHSDLIL